MQGTDDARSVSVATARAGLGGWLQGLSVRSKFLIILLATSLLSMGLVALVSYSVGRDALLRQQLDRLQAISASKTKRLEDYFGNMRDTMRVLGANPLVAQNIIAFSSAYNALGDKAISPEQSAALRAYYATNFIPKVTTNESSSLFVESYLP
ncbi:MAG: hypothetical protein AAFQ42_03110 [Pseudomonadota bacterium]